MMRFASHRAPKGIGREDNWQMVVEPLAKSGRYWHFLTEDCLRIGCSQDGRIVKKDHP